MDNHKILDKVKGALYGVAIGDAMGAPLEFMSKEDIADKYGTVTEMIGGGWMNLEKGQTTDDTSLSLAVARGVLASPDNPIESVGREFIAWQAQRPADIGATCDGAIHKALELASDAKSPSSDDWFKAATLIADDNEGRSGGNGALMRSVYPGLFYAQEDTAVNWSVQIARMTHDDALSSHIVAVYTRLIFNFVRHSDEQEALNYLLQVIDRDLKDELPAQIKSSTWCVDTLNVALYYMLRKQSFEDILVSVVNDGDDSDTAGSVSGSLAGAMYGYSSIPTRWVEALDPEICRALDELTLKAANQLEI
ncbi:MAG: ADP-ribosylglycohydrolase family protein [Succinivibrio sp.]|nr:ADP-ribosylglycohydrolase family protein [Succinivibrio sp.]